MFHSRWLELVYKNRIGDFLDQAPFAELVLKDGLHFVFAIKEEDQTAVKLLKLYPPTATSPREFKTLRSHSQKTLSLNFIKLTFFRKNW